MKSIAAILLIMPLSFLCNGQKVEFDVAYGQLVKRYEQSLVNLRKNCPSNNIGLKKGTKYLFFINEGIVDGKFDWYLYLKNKISLDSLNAISVNKGKLAEVENSLFGKPLFFDPRSSKYYGKHHSKNYKGGGVLVSFAKFDGRFLLLNVKIGCDVYGASSQHSEFDYQVEFKNGSIVDESFNEKRF